MTERISRRTQNLPINLAILYLISTFVLFLCSAMVEKAENLALLIFFVLISYLLFYFGYRFGILTRKNKRYEFEPLPASRVKSMQWMVLLGAIYFATWSINQIVDFSDGVGGLLDSILNPGAAYASKFDVYERRIATGEVNRLTQILIIFSIFYACFIPAFVAYWNNIPNYLRRISVIATAMYGVSFLAIGTQKGIGDVVLFAFAGWSVLVARDSAFFNKRSVKKILMRAALLGLFLLTYMVIAQASRALEFGITSSLLVGDVSNTWLAKLVGNSLANGIYTAFSYPSHGYLGLSYNLDKNFVFSNGAGFAPAFESYRYQYLGGTQYSEYTYPMRTEVLTGWPAGMYWSTAFPWFASDLSFPGTTLLMFVAGFTFARVWIECISKRNIFALAMLGQVFIFIAFLPANNQVLMQRQSLWAVTTIGVLWLTKIFLRRRTW